MIDQFPETLGVYDHLIVHCAATPPSLDEGALWVDRVHRQKGWSRCGYHAVIRRDGRLEWQLTGHPTRTIGMPGAHVGGCGAGWNARCLGVCLMGGVAEDGKTPENNFTPEQLITLAEFIEVATEKCGIDMTKVIGHRDLIKMTGAAPKACPCFSVTEWRDNWEFEPEQIEAYDRVRLAFNWLRDRFKYERNDKLRVPKTYTVKKGDTLWSISRTYGVTLAELRSWNSNEVSNDDIIPGQKLRLLK